jgi:hypothetical protein
VVAGVVAAAVVAAADLVGAGRAMPRSKPRKNCRQLASTDCGSRFHEAYCCSRNAGSQAFTDWAAWADEWPDADEWVDTGVAPDGACETGVGLHQPGGRG